MLKKRRALTEEMMEINNQVIYQRVMDMEAFRQVDAIFAYASYNHEADTFAIIRNALQPGRFVALPKVTDPAKMIFMRIRSLDDLRPGYCGIPEPMDGCEELLPENFERALALVPGAAFDRQLYRLGYGGGYYDAWLKIHKDAVCSCGLAYDFQVQTTIPHEAHDQPLDMIVTPSDVIYL